MTLESNQDITNALISRAGEIGNRRKEELRRKQRENRSQRAARSKNRGDAEAFLREDDAIFKAKARETDTEREISLGSNVNADIDDEGWAFGEDAGLRTGDDRPQDAQQSYTREEKVDKGVLPDEFLTADEQARTKEGFSVLVGGKNPTEGRVASGAPAMADALSRLQEAKETYGYENFGADGPAMQANDDYLSFELQGNSQQIRDQSEARRLVERDQRQANILAQVSNDAKAAAEAEEIRGRLGGLPRQLADEDIGRIDDVQMLGGAQAKVSHDPLAGINYRVSRTEDPSTFGTAIPLVDRDGSIREYYGVEDGAMVQLGEVNLDSTDQVLNAPKMSAGQQFVADNVPNFARPGGTTFGYPQVGINDELRLLGDRVRALKGYGLEGMGDPRSIEDFEKVMGGIVGRAGDAGDTFWRYDKATGKKAAVASPGVADVLYKLGYSEADTSRLANALFQSGAARTEGTNSADKEAFYGRTGSRAANEADINFDVAEMREDDGLTLEKLKNEKIGRGKEARSARGALGAINEETSVRKMGQGGEMRTERGDLLPDAATAIAGAKQARGSAQMPLIGSLEEDPVERSRFMKAEDRGLSEAQLINKYGGSRGMQAAEIERRYLEDERLRSQAAQAGDPIAAEFRKREANLRSKSGLVADPSLTAPRQQIQQAATPASIAPTPGEMTGNQTAPITDAGRGLGREVPGMDYGDAFIDEGSNLPKNLRDELFSLQPTNMPTPPSGIEPDGPSGISKERRRRGAEQRLEQMRTRAPQIRNRKIAQGAGISTGVLASVLGLDAVFGNDEEAS